MPRLLLVACVLLIARPAAAQTWTYASSDHFEVYTTGGDRTAREVLEHFERVHVFFTDFLKLSPGGAPLTRLIVFSNEREFAPYRPNEVAAAYYQPGPDRDYIVMRAFDEGASQVVAHEYSHLVFRRSGARYPLWLNEGFADFFSTLTPDGNKMKVGLPPEGRLYYLREGGQGLMPLPSLFAVGRDSREYNANSHAGLFYSQSWALTHLLLTDANYRPALVAFLDAIDAGSDAGTAIEKAYGRPLATVMHDLNAHVRRDQYRYYIADYTAPPRTNRLPTRRVEAFDAALVTANLLAISRDKGDEARAAFERLAAEKPDDLRLVESRAYFELRRGEAAVAQTYLARAVALGSKTPSVYRDYAVVAPEKAAELLSRAIELDPQDLDTRLRYGSVLLTAGRNGEALAALAKVKYVPRESAFQYFQLLAGAYLRLNEMERARSAAVEVKKYAGPGAQTQYADRLLKSIDDYAASRAAAQKAAREIAAARAAFAEAAARQPTADAPPGAPSFEPAPFTLASGDRSGTLMVVVSGRIRNMECAGGAPILEVATGTGTLRLSIDDGLKISVQGLNTHTVDLQCGKQDVPLRIGYEPVVDPGRKTVGNVRLLDYRK
jgi:hypothetical protein